MRAARRLKRTVQVCLFALLPSAGGEAAPAGPGEARVMEPGDLRGGMGRFLDAQGELRLFFPDCLAPAAPFILFRLKREGFSRCSVRLSPEGLAVRGRR